MRGLTFAFRGEPFTFHGVPPWTPEAEVNTFSQRTRSPWQWRRSYEPLRRPLSLAHPPPARGPPRDGHDNFPPGHASRPTQLPRRQTRPVTSFPHRPSPGRFPEMRRSFSHKRSRDRTRPRRNGRTVNAFTRARHSGMPSIPRRRLPDHAHRGAPRARRPRQATAGAQPASRPAWPAPGPDRTANPRSSPPPPRRTPRAWAARSRPPPPRWPPCAAPPPPPRGPRPGGPARRGSGPAARARARPRRRG